MRVLRFWLPLMLVCTLSLGCAGMAQAKTKKATDEGQVGDSTWSTPEFSPPIVINGSDARLDSLVRPWMGVRHRYGKQSKKGIDCSGFVQVIMQDYLNYKTARSSAKNFQQGDTVHKDELQPGDVVFFANHGHKIDHSGVWIGNGRFAHASTSSGVVVTELDKDHYWSTHFKGARRYLINPAFPASGQLPEFNEASQDSLP